MSEHVGYVVKVENIRKHSNADRLQVATFFGNDTCVSLETKVGDIGIYFPTDLQLSVEYCEANNLVRKKDENGNNIGGYMDPNKRNVTTIKLRGEKSDGIYMPIESLEFTGAKISDFNIGDTIEVVNKIPICCKYIPRSNRRQGHVSDGNRTRKKKIDVAPLFMEHADTEQLAYNLGAFKTGDEIEITLKMHGTSQRTGYLPVANGYKRTFWDKLFKREGKLIYDWGYVSGTRRTVLNDWEGGFYDSNAFRKQHADFFEGKLHKGETVYYEVVGFTDEGTPIMGSVSNKKTNDKDFIKKYGEMTTFSYGCDPNGENDKPKSDFYVYRMTMTNEDGDVVEYTPDFMRYRCEQMGAKCVHKFFKGIIPEEEIMQSSEDGSPVYVPVNPGEWVQKIAERYYDGPDLVDGTHVREGVVIRIVNRPKFAAYKHKNFYFKCIEGLAKADAEVPDMEEAEEFVEEITDSE